MNSAKSFFSGISTFFFSRLKYGKPYALSCRENAIGTVAPKLMHKLSVQAPPKILVEKYLIEIARNYNVAYEPDPQVRWPQFWPRSLIELPWFFFLVSFGS